MLRVSADSYLRGRNARDCENESRSEESERRRRAREKRHSEQKEKDKGRHSHRRHSFRHSPVRFPSEHRSCTTVVEHRHRSHHNNNASETHSGGMAETRGSLSVSETKVCYGGTSVILESPKMATPEEMNPKYKQETAHNTSEAAAEKNVNDQDKGPYLCARYVSELGGDGIRGALGVAFEEKREEWIIADSYNHKVVMCDDAGARRSLYGFTNPSAVAIVEHGKCFAVLDDKCIKVFENEEKSSGFTSAAASSLTWTTSLAAMSLDGNLMTTLRLPGSHLIRVVVYALHGHNMLVQSCIYADTRTHPTANPCFMHSSGHYTTITDLGVNQVAVFCYRRSSSGLGTRLERVCTRGGMDQLDVHGKPLPKQAGINFAYVSGVFVDSEGTALIADAKARALYAMDAEKTVLQEVVCTMGFPYMSQIAAAPNWRVAVCKRRAGGVALYQLYLSPHKSGIDLNKTDSFIDSFVRDDDDVVEVKQKEAASVQYDDDIVWDEGEQAVAVSSMHASSGEQSAVVEPLQLCSTVKGEVKLEADDHGYAYPPIQPHCRQAQSVCVASSSGHSRPSAIPAEQIVCITIDSDMDDDEDDDVMIVEDVQQRVERLQIADDVVVE